MPKSLETKLRGPSIQKGNVAAESINNSRCHLTNARELWWIAKVVKTAELSNIVMLCKTRMKHIPKSRCRYRKSHSCNIGIDFRDKKKIRTKLGRFSYMSKQWM